MKTSRAGFTLTELMIVLAIVAVIVAVLFPVFSQAKQRAMQTGWIESHRQIGLATNMYLADYDDKYMIAQYQPVGASDPTTDRTWVQNLLPYARSFSSFLCPADSSRGNTTNLSAVVSGDTYSRYYRASMRSNIGYNFLYFAPVVYDGAWRSRPRSQSEISDPSMALLFADSAYKTVNGVPQGGGNFLIVPPCRFRQDNNSDSFGLGNVSPFRIFRPNNPWQTVEQAQEEYVAGGLYPWYFNRVTTVNSLGGIRSRDMSDLTRGCDVRPNWNGLITDTAAYLWDLN